MRASIALDDRALYSRNRTRPSEDDRPIIFGFEEAVILGMKGPPILGMKGVIMRDDGAHPSGCSGSIRALYTLAQWLPRLRDCLCSGVPQVAASRRNSKQSVLPVGWLVLASHGCAWQRRTLFLASCLRLAASGRGLLVRSDTGSGR